MFFLKNKTRVKIIGVVVIVLQIIIDFMLNWIPTGNNFNIGSLFTSIPFWILVCSIIVYIILNVYIGGAEKKTSRKNSKLNKALVDKKVYETAAETMGECIKSGDYKKFKSVRKMTNML